MRVACGANRPSRVQVRFVEDNWENPALGAWGLGWEVWMDGARSPHAEIMQPCFKNRMQVLNAGGTWLPNSTLWLIPLAC